MQVPAAITGEKPKISVTLSDSRDKDIKYFHCLVCGHKVFGYYSNAKIILPGESKFMESPIVVQCNGAISVEKNGMPITTRCKTIYYVG